MVMFDSEDQRDLEITSPANTNCYEGFERVRAFLHRAYRQVALASHDIRVEE